MVANIVNLLSKAVSAKNISSTKRIAPSKAATNPFANPFVSTNGQRSAASYAKNKPVQGGYFAGYHNGKANIVGQRLFLEV